VVPQIEMCKQSLLQKRKAPSQELNPEPLKWLTWNLTGRLPDWHWCNDKL